MGPATVALLAPALALIAAAYASVGLGGGTAYLSVLALWDADPQSLRPVAWTLNCVVSAIGFISYQRRGHFSFARSWALLLGGLVGGAIGASLPLGAQAFRVLLALTLLVVGVRMLLGAGRSSAGEGEGRSARPLALLALGTVVGIVSGLVGIGGGIILGPIVIALGWLSTKRTAALTSLYILLTSVGALGAFLAAGGSLPLERLGIWAAAVVVGGFVGSRWGAGKASPRTLRRIFGTVAVLAGGKIAVAMIGWG